MEVVDLLLFIFPVGIMLVIVLFVRQMFKHNATKNELASTKKEVEKLRGKISMLEYYYRNYREGENPYTVLRKMGDVLQGYERYEDIRK